MGALFSAKVDLPNTVSAAVDGVGFTGGIFSPGGDVHVATSLYVQSNGTNQFANGTTGSKSTDAITPGGYFQMDFPIGTQTQSIRFRSGESFASSGNSRDATTVFEWQPTLPLHVGQFNLGKRIGVPAAEWVGI